MRHVRAVSISASVNESAMTLTRRTWGKGKQFVYVISANKRIRRTADRSRYSDRGSRIIYIGSTTRIGKRRTGYNVARIADKTFLDLNGVNALTVKILKCGTARRNCEPAQQLEGALIRRFKYKYRYRPYYNRNDGPKVFVRFTEKRLDNILEDLG